MKIIKLSIFGILLLYFQVMIAPKFIIFGLTPNFLPAYLIFLNIHHKTSFTIPFAFFIGLAYDLIHPSLLGMNTFSFLIISYIVNNQHKSITKNNFSIVSIFIIIINAIYYLIFFFFHLFALKPIQGLIPLISFAIFYNSILTIITVYLFSFINKIKLSINV